MVATRLMNHKRLCSVGRGIAALLALLAIVASAYALPGNYDRALGLVLRHEGGWNHCDTRDPGGCTLNGITQGRYDGYRRDQGLPPAALSPALLKDTWWINVARPAIYRQYYAVPCYFDALPAGVDYLVFDYCVHSGPGRVGRVARCLVQTALPRADCMRVTRSPLDDDVVHAVIALGGKFIPLMCNERRGFARALPHYAGYRNGWERRFDDVCGTALAWSRGRQASNIIASIHPAPGKAYEPEVLQ